MDDTVDYLASHGILFAKEGEVIERASKPFNATLGVTYGMLWLDIEDSSVSCD